jgi:type VI secretion system secreted protein VgrG
VVGKSGEEITVDQYGRVKVQFYWDREGKEDENSSCWIRVSQLIAGQNWGAIFIPRIGQEVIVDFLEGDPDRPIITGRVYNAAQMPPGTLPQYQDISGIRTHSTRGGGEHDANVLSFCDTKGSEVLYMHAQKDMATRVENNDDLKVGNDQTEDIGHDRTTTIHHDKTLNVLNNRTSTISASDSETVGKDQSVTIGTSQTNTIGTTQDNTIGASQSTDIGGSRTATIGGADNLAVGGMLSIACGGAMSVEVGGATMITSGGPVMITAPLVLINGVLVVTQPIITAVGVVSPLYTPGLGNLI